MSRGPATLRDFVWWSGLTAADARAGLELVKQRLSREVFGGETYWLASSAPAARDDAPAAYLLPAFDEYTVAYKDRDAVLHPSQASLVNAGSSVLSPVVIIGGRVVGTWKRELKKDSVVVTPSLFVALKASERRALNEATQRYGEFLCLSAELA
jgi:hypothetical protein